jgi:pimeloyl-CoA synthetase
MKKRKSKETRLLLRVEKELSEAEKTVKELLQKSEKGKMISPDELQAKLNDINDNLMAIHPFQRDDD